MCALVECGNEGCDLLMLSFKIKRSQPAAAPTGAGSVDVLEQLHNLLHPGNPLHQVGRLGGFLLGQQAQQVDDAVLGHHLDARAEDVRRR